MSEEIKRALEIGRLEGRLSQCREIKNWLKMWFAEFDVDGRKILYKITDTDIRDMLLELDMLIDDMQENLS